jgi:hypothetical protein
MLAIAQKLEKLSALYQARESLHSEKRRVIADVLTPEVLTRLDEIEAEFAQKELGATTAIDALESEIKADTLAHGETVKASGFLAVWTKGRVSWDSKGLAGYAQVHPEVLEYRKEGEPSVTVRRAQAKDQSDQ